MRPALSRLSWWIALLFATSLLVRSRMVSVPLVGTEAFHLSLAHFGGQGPAPIVDVAGHVWEWTNFIPGRPVYYSLLRWPAEGSFEAARWFNVALASAMAPTAFMAFRAWGVRTAFALLGGLTIAVHPLFSVQAVQFSPVLLATLLFIAVLWAHGRRNPRWLAGALIASFWADRFVALSALPLMALAIIARPGVPWRERLARPDPVGTAYLVGFAAGLAPLSFSGVPFYFFDRSQEFMSILLGGTMNLLGLLLLCGALLMPRSRGLAMVASANLLILIGAQVLWGRTAGGIQFASAAILAIGAMVLFLDAVHLRGGGLRSGLWKTGVGIVGLALVAGPLLPSPPDHPWSVVAGPSVFAMTEQLESDGRTTEELSRFLRTRSWSRAFVVDVALAYWIEPVQVALGGVPLTLAFSHVPVNLTRWSVEIEAATSGTVVANSSAAATNAVRVVYGDCITFANRDYFVVEAAACRGRAAQFAEEYWERSLAMLPQSSPTSSPQ